ncbi:MAG TPA: 50S ribosomal protein L21 [Dehalococcoidia bacterium]|nr:50S ribosomal protein L21 [Dehalococcoidia bacterium]
MRSGGRQYRVEPDQLLDVDRLPAAVGSLVEITDVLLLGGNGDVKVGAPLVEGARVVAEVVEHGRDKKVLVFKYKAKTRYRRKKGHRQDYTRLAIRQILAAGESAEAPAEAPPEARPKRAPRRKAAASAAAEAPAAATKARPRRAAKATATAEAQAPTAEAVAEAPVRPRRTARAAPAAKAEAPAAEAEEAPVAEAAADAPETAKDAPARPRRTRKKAESD